MTRLEGLGNHDGKRHGVTLEGHGANFPKIKNRKLGKILGSKYLNFYIFGGWFTTLIMKLESYKVWICYQKERKKMQEGLEAVRVSKVSIKGSFVSFQPMEGSLLVEFSLILILLLF